jgi:hypothetical protein
MPMSRAKVVHRRILANIPAVFFLFSTGARVLPIARVQRGP